METAAWFEENGAVSRGWVEIGSVAVDDGPICGVLTLPKSVLFGILGSEVAGFVTEIGNCSMLGWGELGA